MNGGTENSRHEKTAPSKMQFVKMQDIKNRNQTTGMENARHENTGKGKRVHE